MGEFERNIMYIYFLVAALAYCIGTINPALIISKAKKKDIRSYGTGNLGASNTTILLGWKWGVVVGLTDILKAFIPITVVKYILPEYELLPYIVATCVVLGHIFPFYLKFKGGKGFATYMGSILGLSFWAFVVIGVIFLIVSFVSDYIVVGTITVVGLFPIWIGMFSGNVWFTGIVLIASLVIIYKHRNNLVKIKNKEEIGIRSAFTGKHKI